MVGLVFGGQVKLSYGVTILSAILSLGYLPRILILRIHAFLC